MDKNDFLTIMRLANSHSHSNSHVHYAIAVCELVFQNKVEEKPV